MDWTDEPLEDSQPRLGRVPLSENCETRWQPALSFARYAEHGDGACISVSVTQGETRWFDPAAWAECAGHRGYEWQVWLRGPGPISRGDFSAWVLYFPEGHKVLARIFLAGGRTRQAHPYTSATGGVAAEGNLSVTRGTRSTTTLSRRRSSGHHTYDIREVGFDPGRALQVKANTSYRRKGWSWSPCGSGFATLSAPSKALEELVISGS